MESNTTTKGHCDDEVVKLILACHYKVFLVIIVVSEQWRLWQENSSNGLC
jgi:hypothetical protein